MLEEARTLEETRTSESSDNIKKKKTYDFEKIIISI